MATIDQDRPIEYTLPSQLMAKPALTWDEFWGGLLNLPESTAVLLMREEPAPQFFMLGRRRYIRRADVIAWIDQVSQAKPYSPRRNMRRIRMYETLSVSDL